MTSKTTFKEIPYTDVMKQINGQPIREPIYYFGNKIKRQPTLELPGKPYGWTKDIEELNND